MKTIYSLFLILFAFLFIACNPAPKPIDFGGEACHYCKMTIMDAQHASQLMTKKGRTYNFDAIECMLHSLQDDLADKPVKLHQVSDFATGKLIDAASATFLISPTLPSPMGANLSAFKNPAEAQKAVAGAPVQQFSWTGIQEYFQLKRP